MTNHISIDQARLFGVLDEIRSSGASTALTTDIIEKFMGGFHSNLRVPVGASWNAQFGKYLKANSLKLDICEVAAKVPVVINGRQTTASRWNLDGNREVEAVR